MNPEELNPPPAPATPEGEPRRLRRFWVISLILTAPAVIAWLAVSGGFGHIVPQTVIIGSAAAGLACGFLAVRETRLAPVAKALVFAVCCPLFGFTSLTLGFLGCAAGQAMGGKGVPFP